MGESRDTQAVKHTESHGQEIEELRQSTLGSSHCLHVPVVTMLVLVIAATLTTNGSAFMLPNGLTSTWQAATSASRRLAMGNPEWFKTLDSNSDYTRQLREM